MSGAPFRENALTEGYQYEAYGTATVFTSPGLDSTWFTGDESPAGASANGNSSLFTGRRLDAATNLHYCRTRSVNIAWRPG